MGILVSRPARVLELQLSYPSADPPPAVNGAPRAFFARVGTLNDRVTTLVRWDEAVAVRLQESDYAVVITLLTARSAEALEAGDGVEIFAEVCLPYPGASGLSALGVYPGGPAHRIHLALRQGHRLGQGSGHCAPEELAQEFVIACEMFHPNALHLALMVRELPTPDGPPEEEERVDDRARSGSDSEAVDIYSELPSAKKQVAILEIENAVLKARRREVEPSIVDHPQSQPPSHIRRLQRIEQENEQYRTDVHEVRLMVKRIRGYTQATHGNAASSSSAPDQAGVIGDDSPTDWGRSLRVMHAELSLCKERQEKIHQMFEERMNGLRSKLEQEKLQLSQLACHCGSVFVDDVEFCRQCGRRRPRWQGDDGGSHSHGSAHNANGSMWQGGEGQSSASADNAGEMEEQLEQERATRDELSLQLRKLHASEQAAGPRNTTDIARAEEDAERWKLEMEQLKHELADQQGAENGIEAETTDQLRGTLEQFREQLEMLETERRDVRVRNDDETRDLKKQRDERMDRLGEVRAELQVIQAQADAYRNMKVDGETVSAPCTSELQTLRSEYDKQAVDLSILKQKEQDRYQTIRDIEEEQVALVRTASIVASQAMPASEAAANPAEHVKRLEAQVLTLQTQLARKTGG